MATPAVTYTFAANTLIQASQANTNFQDIVDFLTNEVIQKDASTAFTVTPAGPASDPTTANQFTRKAYVDNLVPKIQRFGGSNVISNLGAGGAVTCNLYSGSGYPLPSGGGIITFLTIDWSLGNSSEQEIQVLPFTHLSVVGTSWVERVPNTTSGTPKGTTTMQFFYTAAAAMTWTPKVQVVNGLAPNLLSVSDLQATHIFVPGGTSPFGSSS